MSLELAEWILSTIVQSQAAIIGFNVASISIVVVFLYRSGQFHKFMDNDFSSIFPKYMKTIKWSFYFGILSIILSTSSLIILEIIPDRIRALLSIFSSIILFFSTFLSASSAFLILKVLEKKWNREK